MVFAAAQKVWKLTRGLGAFASANYAHPARDFVMMRRDIQKSKLARTILGLACAIPLAAGTGPSPYLVTQKNQTFEPGFLPIHRGETVEILNDDGELIHHAYIDSKSFSFDSGDQEPGSKTDIVFSVPGNLVVLCGIHPKMHLDVVVK